MKYLAQDIAHLESLEQAGSISPSMVAGTASLPKDGTSIAHQPTFMPPSTFATAKTAIEPASSSTVVPVSAIAAFKRCNRFKYGKRYQCYYPGCTFRRTTLEELQCHLSPKATVHPRTRWGRSKAIEIYVEDPNKSTIPINHYQV
jgi:hypothetical protein